MPKSRKTLTFDEVLCEIEHEQRLTEADKVATFESQLYDKKYITFREFLNYFKEFKTAEERYRQEKYENNKEVYLSQPIPKLEESEDNEEVLEQVSRLREEDKIDASEDHLDLIRDIFDSIPRVDGHDDAVYKIEFFLTIRKDPQVRKIFSAIAREPAGKSRIQRETFQEVFNRMEKYELSDILKWPTIIEYFTKRGRPLTDDEKAELLQQDKAQDEMIIKQEEEAKQEEKEFYDKLRNSDDESFHVSEDDPLKGDEFIPTYGREDLQPQTRGVRFDEGTRFRDSLNDRDLSYSGAKRFNRSQEREDLSQIQLKNRDFEDYNRAFKKRSRSTTKEYKITVPRTFKFEKRAELRPMTIREWKVEKMIQEKRIEEQLSHKHFKASRPPPEVLIPQYKSIVEKEMKRRKEVKETSKARTKANEWPFEFYKREERKKQLKEQIKKEEKEFKHKFKARNVPLECATEKMKNPETEKFIREQRIKERAKKLYEESKLPPNMHKHEQQMNKRKGERMKALEKELFEFDRRPKRRDKPNFDKLHQDFNDQLDKKKKEFKPSKVIPFNLTEHKERIAEIEEAKEDPKAFMKLLAGAVMKTAEKPAPVPTTKKQIEAIERKKKEEIDLEAENEEQRKKEEQKKQQTLSMKTVVQTKIAQEDRTQEKKMKRKEELENKKLSNKIEERKIKKHLDEVVQKGQSRDLQIDGYESTSEIMKRFRQIRNTMGTLEKLGLPLKPVGGNN